MNEAEDKPIATHKPRQAGVSGVLSLVLPLFGFVIAYCAAHSGRGSYEGMRDAFTGFALWSFASLVGAICAFVSFRHHGLAATSSLGLVLCSAPLLYFLYIMAINSK